MRVTRRDIRQLHRTVFNLSAASNLASVLLVVLAAVAWWPAVQKIRAFGETIDYSGLEALGPTVVERLQEYNPIFWWLAIIIGTLLLVYVLYALVMAIQRRLRRKLVRQATISGLVQQLSEPAREVLSWAWHDRREPISVGILQQALIQMHGGRASRIALAREHAAALAPAQGEPEAPARELPGVDKTDDKTLAPTPKM